MNFLKWLMNILFGWILYVPKKIMQEIEKYFSFKAMSLNYVKEFLVMPKQGNGPLPIQSTNLDIILSATIFVILAVLINENFIASCLRCQTFIDFMSTYVTSMTEMSHHHTMPQIVLFELSFAYTILPLYILIFLFRNRNIRYDTVDTSSTQFIRGYFLLFAFLCFMTYISFHAAVLFLFFPEHQSQRLLDLIIQTKIGLSLWIWLLTYLTSKSFAVWLLMNVAIVKKINHEDIKNEA
ncbi:hypothetical protein [Sulfuricurvum sp.]|uniref:hypothetical protein n=1 Tax=Sulfuricurvum sp. TaxID=2025608 RepID=UPI002613F425|nr:hypothetical protein [Sulfuricurvum sp.]MDD2780868.1 hypothetical protein [Sulfuricurvum sp.]